MKLFAKETREKMAARVSRLFDVCFRAIAVTLTTAVDYSWPAAYLDVNDGLFGELCVNQL